jgi:hypothetical protein
MRNDSYAERLNRNLKQYRDDFLKISEPGIWKHHGVLHEYKHILPAELRERNLLPTVRESFEAYKKKYPIKLHRYFHHLNSSQALCFNLFFPFMQDEYQRLPLLLDILGIDQGKWEGSFERVFIQGENTNFDFYMNRTDGEDEAFFELKLSERGFGTADIKHYRKKYEDKLELYYREPLQGCVEAKWFELETLAANYQILRNISYLGRPQHRKSRLFFIYPKANDSLALGLEAIKAIRSKSLSKRVTLMPLEDLVEQILNRGSSDEFLQEHFQEFKAKYIL